MRKNNTCSDAFRRGALIDAALLGVLEQDGAEREDRFLPDRHAGSDLCEGADPCAVLDDDRLRRHPHAGIRPVVIAGTEVDALRDADVAADCDRDEVVDPGALAEPDVVADSEAPRVLHVEGRLDVHVASDLRAEGAEDLRLESGRQEDRVEQRERFDDDPEKAEPGRFAGVVVAVRSEREIHLSHWPSSAEVPLT